MKNRHNRAQTQCPSCGAWNDSMRPCAQAVEEFCRCRQNLRWIIDG